MSTIEKGGQQVKIVRNREGSVSILEISAAQFVLIVDSVNEVNRSDNPCRPFGADFQGLIDRLRLALAKGAELFTIEHGPAGTVYRCPLLRREVAAVIAKARGKASPL